MRGRLSGSVIARTVLAVQFWTYTCVNWLRTLRAAFPKGNLYMQMRDVLGTIYYDEDFSELFEVRGRRAITPWRLALVTVMQFSEGLSDRQAAEAVRARIDWKYALGLQLSDPGFNFSVLSEFRSRLVEGGKERLLLEKLLQGCKERGYIKVRGRQRTDSTHVLGALRVLSKWERTLHCLPSRARHKILSNNSLERVNKEIKNKNPLQIHR